MQTTTDLVVVVEAFNSSSDLLIHSWTPSIHSPTSKVSGFMLYVVSCSSKHFSYFICRLECCAVSYDCYSKIEWLC